MIEQNLDQSDATVSVIIPAHNEEKMLGALLASLAVLQFPRERLQIIVVDHESSDATADVARQGGAQVVTKKGGTISSVRNCGAAVASGQVLAFVDADCTVAEDWINKALPHLSDSTVGLVGSPYLMPAHPQTWVRKVLQKQADVRPRLSAAKWLPAGNMFIRRDVYWESSGFDESLTTCEDVDLCFRISQRYRVIADADIRCWHYGEPKNLREVFRKELWRGRDNLGGAFRHGLQLYEIPSLLLPLYFLFLSVLVVILIGISVLTNWEGSRLIAWMSIALLLPLVMIAGVTAFRSGDWHHLPHFAVFYAIYFWARGLAPFYEWRNT
ncbi:MAG: glycosyltransferase [Deltaproteobacteria bacterium]|nr:glycosyltransferase [Deltaproteobacteria bacterium]